MCACMPFLPALFKDMSVSSQTPTVTSSSRSQLLQPRDGRGGAWPRATLSSQARGASQQSTQKEAHIQQLSHPHHFEKQKLPGSAAPKRPPRPPIGIPESCLRIPFSPVMEDFESKETSKRIYRSIEIL